MPATDGRGATFAASLVCWPNAPYLLTVLELVRARPPAPLWLDVVLLGTSAWAGCLLARDSLSRVHLALREHVGQLPSALTVAGDIVRCGMGAFLGRSERLNSSDVLTNPRAVTQTCLAVLLTPWAVTFSLTWAALPGAGSLFTAGPHAGAPPTDAGRRLGARVTSPGYAAGPVRSVRPRPVSPAPHTPAAGASSRARRTAGRAGPARGRSRGSTAASAPAPCRAPPAACSRRCTRAGRGAGASRR
ncbi:MAG: DUF1361 domain-containing protein, partial [Myxococcaceae bacterium]|nr:DUF1361 domain-containing protein [Myxococcaceae bacterium]